LGALVDVGVSSLGINATTLNSIGAHGGDVYIFSATLDPIVHLNPHGRFDVYVTGGGGEYRRSQTFGPALLTGGFSPNPFLFTNSAGSSVFHYNVNKPGYDVGIGVSVGTRWHGKIFAEAKYNHIFLNGFQHTDYLPVTFGYRW
jgi:hypothetical protein